MADEMKRPYAPPANVVAVIRRTQQINLPDVIDNDFLRVAQISENLFGRVHDALRFLKLVDESGHPEEVLQDISAAGEEEYRTLLAGVVREAYGDDFNRIDPAQDTQAVIVDAFRRYSPRSQTKRMVMLFLGLCREAGIPVLEAPRERKMSAAGPRRRTESKPNKANKVGSGASGRAGHQPPPPERQDPGTLFGVTQEDIELLSDDEFDEVWDALGKVVRARGRKTAKTSPPATDQEASDQGGQI